MNPELQARLAEGERLLDEGALEEAERALRQAIAIDVRYAPAHSKLGVTLARSKRYDEAIECFRDALEVDPLFAAAYSNLGNVYYEQNRESDAIAAYKKAVEVDPDYWIGYQNLAAVYKKQGNYHEFVRNMKKATRLSARAPERRSWSGETPASGGGKRRRWGCLPGAAILAIAATAAWLRFS